MRWTRPEDILFPAAIGGVIAVLMAVFGGC